MDLGDCASETFTVTDGDTARALGSGALSVLATPMLLAWCEAATCAALADTMPAHRTSVSTRVQLEHLAASPVGARIEVTATVVYVDGRLVRFDVVATDRADQRLVGRGECTRVVVDRGRFLSRLG